MNDLLELDDWLAGLIERLEPLQRKKLMQQWAHTLRRRQQKSIQQRQNPDGTPFAQRKPQKREKAGRVRRKMFTKLRTARFLKVKDTTNTAEVTFAGGAAQRIAQVHHYGPRDRVGRRGVIFKYPERQLLEFNDTIENDVSGALIEHLIK
ncbi:phage virion morphogenesis protein [Sodalis sp. RH15]|uniref:phage virion morphogenesis protein n=1 Tax=Sodalis sp. RH15 TaxID=3394330 RepID=UPI0039B56FC3